MADATKTVTIAEENFDLPVKYSEGHTLNEAEAAVLSQTWFENVRNNTARFVKAGNDPEQEMTPEAARAKVEEYAAGYEFSLAGVGGGLRSYSPLDREARKLVRAAITKQYKAQGILIKNVDPEQIEAAIEANYQKEEVQKIAQQNLKRAEQIQELMTG